ncbi:hypothetical protein FRB93_012176 [Tulasnella sp. JGI-2019a]|nr:hypothetical protein FRB93_012176 [Tulasnella sp. JGI-2019a]
MSGFYIHQQQTAAATSAPVTAVQAPRGALVDYSSPSCHRGSDEEDDDIDGEPIVDEDPRSVYRMYRDYLATRPTQAPQVQLTAIQADQSSPQSLKRQRDDDDQPATPPTLPRSGGSPSHVRHIPATSPSRQRIARRSTTPVATEEESAPLPKRTRVDTSVTPATTVVSVPTPILDNHAQPTAKPLADRRPSRQATKPGNSYTERQAKLADVSDSKKRADLKKKVKVAVATQAASNHSKTDLDEVAEPEPAIAATPKAKKVAATTTRKRTKKAVDVKDSSKKAAVKTKAKKKTAANARTQTNDASTSTGVRRSRRLQSSPVPVAEEENVDEEAAVAAAAAAAAAAAGGQGEGPTALPRRSNRLRR